MGINAQNHDASISVIKDNELVFTSHSERFSRKKNDYHLSDELIEYALQFGYPDKVIWSEKPWKKTLRRVLSGRFDKLRYNPHDSFSNHDFDIECVGQL